MGFMDRPVGMFCNACMGKKKTIRTVIDGDVFYLCKKCIRERSIEL